MSVEAVGWAFRQRVPPKPKVVLLALADQTDEVTGAVCYGKTDMKALASKASIGERSVYRYIAALIRNGYVLKASGKAEGRASEYWLCLDRVRAESMKDWSWKDGQADVSDDEESEDADPQDVVEGSAILADPPEPETEASDVQIGRGGLPHGGRHESSAKHLTSSTRARGEKESSFSRQAQNLALEAISIQAAAKKENARYFVIEHTQAWRDWTAYRGRSMPTCAGVGEHAGKRGWYMPSLFPPPKASTDPPKPQSIEDDDSNFTTEHGLG